MGQVSLLEVWLMLSGMTPLQQDLLKGFLRCAGLDLLCTTLESYSSQEI